jgi:hypothetical protein
VTQSGGDRPPAVEQSSVEFGPKSVWLAVASDQPGAVADALGLADRRAAGWSEALGLIQRHPPAESLPVFVSSPIRGWTLVVLPPSFAELDVVDLGDLSRKLGEVQKFATHRVVDSHRWERWVDGAALRRYWWVGESGEIRLDEGEPAAAEGRVARRSDLEGDWDDLDFADENTVLDVAGEWSLDPSELPAGSGATDGLLGYVSGRSRDE